MRLVGATVVRDAADIIEPFVRHNLTLLDQMAIVDHGSCDGTSEILAALAAERLPISVARSDTPALHLSRPMNRLVRHVFSRTDAEWVFPLDADEFLKVESREELVATCAAIPPDGHLVLPWLTYVPRFDAGADVLPQLRSARRVAQQRHGFEKVAVGRAFANAAGQRLGKGYHAVEGEPPSSGVNAGVKSSAGGPALAHVPIRSARQFIAKFATGWLSAVASGTLQGGEAFHWREAFAHLRAGRPVDKLQLEAFALNYGVPRERWLPSTEIELLDDPFLANVELRYSQLKLDDPLAIVLNVAERLLARPPAQG
jgi:hypothetical protein